jgi:hypothetical protein
MFTMLGPLVVADCLGIQKEGASTASRDSVGKLPGALVLTALSAGRLLGATDGVWNTSNSTPLVPPGPDSEPPAGLDRDFFAGAAANTPFHSGV